MKKFFTSLFARYLWQSRLPICLFLAYSLIFAAVFSLYDLETEAVLYAFSLSMLLYAFVLSVHFFFYRKSHKERMRILKEISLFTDALPKPATLAEADYQEMVRQLKKLLDESVTCRQNDLQESMDYYTAWIHQIKTPISVMKMTLEGEDTDECRELLAELFRIEQYAEMALNYLRLGSETSDYVFSEYDLDVIIRQAVRKYAPQFIRKKIRLQYEPRHIMALTDEKWLLFIVEQLLSNSIKYTQEGSVTITVSPEPLIKIADTGIGIAAEDLPRIFEKGYTGYNGRMDKKSTGLGLYLCKTAAKRLSHKITADSSPKKGTAITIDLRSNTAPLE